MDTEPADAAKAGPLHISRLNSIRFLAALWVAIGHGAIPISLFIEQGPIGFIFKAANATFDGVAAVMIFFIVSGLCIHLPYSGKVSFSLTSFYIRRFVRVAVPLSIAILVAHFFGERSVVRLDGVTWSVYAELFYYTIYPVFFGIARKTGWSALVIGASLGTLVVCVIFRHETHISVIGWAVWFWGLPIWLSGCWMANWFRAGGFPKFPGSLILWRLVCWVASVAAIMLVFQSPIKVGYQFSMIFFSFVAFIWLTKELRQRRSPAQLMENFGNASYSLYLIHPIVIGVVQSLNLQIHAPWYALLMTAATALSTALFYYCVEAPSHHLARLLSQLVVQPFKPARTKLKRL